MRNIVYIVLFIIFTIILINLFHIVFFKILYYKKITRIRESCILIVKSSNIDIKYKYLVDKNDLLKTINNMCIRHNGTNTYVVNDGSIIYLDLTADIDVIMYVICHELAHMTMNTPYHINEHNNRIFSLIQSEYVHNGFRFNVLKHKTNDVEYGKYTIPSW